MPLEELIRCCPRCGKPIQVKEGRLLECPTCHFTLYLAPAACNGAILTNNTGDILLVKRALEPMKGYWDLPGGFMNYDETIEESVLREIHEELNTKPLSIHYFRSYYDTYVFKDVPYHTLGLIFTGTVDPLNLSAQDDISSYSFFKTTSLPFKQIAFPSVKQALKDYLAMLR